jgi:predicted RNase H-like HicB family nuclease
MWYDGLMKRKETIGKMNAQYICTFRPEPEGGYTVRCAAFPGLITNGRTLEKARANARESLELCLDVYRLEGRPLPASDAEPRKIIKELVPVKLARV